MRVQRRKPWKPDTEPGDIIKKGTDFERSLQEAKRLPGLDKAWQVDGFCIELYAWRGGKPRLGVTTIIRLPAQRPREGSSKKVGNIQVVVGTQCLVLARLLMMQVTLEESYNFH